MENPHLHRMSFPDFHLPFNQGVKRLRKRHARVPCELLEHHFRLVVDFDTRQLVVVLVVFVAFHVFFSFIMPARRGQKIENDTEIAFGENGHNI